MDAFVPPADWPALLQRPQPEPSLVRRFLTNLARVILIPLSIYLGCVVVLSLVWTQVQPPVTALMVYRSLQGVSVKPIRPLPLGKIPRYIPRAIVYLEDHQFWTHHGLVAREILDAWKANQRLGYTAYGGSTITQQLARNLFLFPDKLWIRKALEAGTAVIIESLLSKQRIMEIYLNSIEWGSGVFGLEAGARFHFGTGVRNLSQEQLARLLAIITNPVKYNVRTLWDNRGMRARYWALMDW